MPCCAPLCPFNAVKVSSFGVPKNETLKLKWEKALGVSLKPHSKVCRRHFRKEDITDTWESGEGSSKYVIDLKRPNLRKGAIPYRFALSVPKVPMIEDSRSNNNIDTVSQKDISLVSQSSKVSKVFTDQGNLGNDNKSGSDTINGRICTSVSKRIASPSNYINPPKRIKKEHWIFQVILNNKNQVIFSQLRQHKNDFAKCTDKPLILSNI
ncbi:uncharacterized protein LOC126551206 [Aphis gossypii]|uniref:uncharacterized protein LOC126551206 n=1 Tax=Aphis gossypii TaxID=80765 RepID=UPI0021597966|nr:uncharacterized protein LOC126551206 [Aphis gossypii]